MVIFYKKWKKYNELQLTKNKMDLNIRKITNHPPSPVMNYLTIQHLLSVQCTPFPYRRSKFANIADRRLQNSLEESNPSVNVPMKRVTSGVGSVPMKQVIPGAGSVPMKQVTPWAGSVPMKQVTPGTGSVPMKQVTPLAGSVPMKQVSP